MINSQEVKNKTDEAINRFLNHFSGHPTYNDPENYEVNVTGGAGSYLEMRIKEEHGARRARFIFEESSDEPVVEWYSGHQGGGATATWEVNADNYHYIKGNGAKSNRLNLGTNGDVKGILLGGEGEVKVDHSYSCKGFHRRRTWTLELK